MKTNSRGSNVIIRLVDLLIDDDSSFVVIALGRSKSKSEVAVAT